MRSPTPPNPASLATAQAEANRVNVYSPTGSMTYGTVDEDGNFVQSPGHSAVMMSETETQRGLREKQEAIAGQLMGTAEQYANNLPTDRFSLDGTPAGGGYVASRAGELRRGDSIRQVDPRTGQVQTSLSNSGLPQLANTQTGFSAERQRAEDAVFNRGMSKLGPLFQMERDRVAQDLANRGLTVGSEAYNNALDRVDRSQGEQLENLALSSVGAGGQEQSRMFGLASGARGQLFGERATQGQFGNQAVAQQFQQDMGTANLDLSRGQFHNAATGQAMQMDLASAARADQVRQNAIQDALMERNQGLNESITALGGAPQFSLPAYNGSAPIDVMTPALAQYQAQNNNYQGAMSGIAGLGQAAIMGAFM